MNVVMDTNGDAIEIGYDLLHRYTASGITTYLDDAVQTLRNALALKPGSVILAIQLSLLLNTRFGRLGESMDYEEIISLLRRVSDNASEAEKPLVLSILGLALQSRFERADQLEDIEASISLQSYVVDLTPDEHHEKPARLSNLCIALLSRFERIGELEDLDAAIQAGRRGVELAPIPHINPAILNNLGIALRTRFECIGELEDLDAAIYMTSNAVDLTSDKDILRTAYLTNLGVALRSRFERTGELDDLDTAISVTKNALALTPDDHPDKPVRLNNLSVALYSRFGCVGDLEDLEFSISTGRCAVDLAPDGRLDKPTWLSNLGNSLQARFECIGVLEDIEAAISIKSRAVELTPDDHPDKPSFWNNLGIALQSRFERVGELEDLEAAISASNRAVLFTPDYHTDKPSRLNNLSIALHRRFVQIGELDNLEAAIRTQSLAIELVPDGHPTKPSMLTNLSASLQRRLERTEELGDLEAAISAGRRAVDLTDDRHPDKPSRLSNLGDALRYQFERINELEDLEAVIYMHSRAVDLTPEGHPDKPGRLNNLANALKSRFESIGELEDLDAVISMRSRSVELTPVGHPATSALLTNLGDALRTRFERDQSRTDFDVACECFTKASMQSSCSPSARFTSARRYVGLLSDYPDYATTASLLEAHSHVLRILPEFVWLGYNLDRRYEESSQLAEDVYNAVSTAIRFGKLERAIEWLETGRTVVWSQLLALRTPLDELEVYHPGLARSLRETQQQLRCSVHMLRSDGSHVADGILSATPYSFNTAPDRHRNLSIKYDRLLSEIRRCEGFQDFLRPKTLLTKKIHGYFVFLHVYRTGCDALILLPSGTVLPVPLPELSEDRASDLRSQWTNELRECDLRVRGSVSAKEVRGGKTDLGYVLESLWKWIVHPVLCPINAIDTNRSDSMPHITWCPTGPLAQLPLHAAGVYSVLDGPRLFDHAVSSYSPSLSTFLRSSDGLAHQQSLPSMFLVTQPATPGQSPLPETMNEGCRLEQLLEDSQIQCEMLSDREATVAAVRTSMNQHTWVHLACHGSQHTGNAIQSAFHLHDGPLSLIDLMQTVSNKAELAFLSACQTATGDENNPEEAVHLAAGMLAVGFKGVVATMWSIGDADAPIVVEAYYKKLLELRRTGAVGKGETGAAYALHEAVKVLRDRVGERNFLSWAPFVHFGV